MESKRDYTTFQHRINVVNWANKRIKFDDNL